MLKTFLLSALLIVLTTSDMESQAQSQLGSYAPQSRIAGSIPDAPVPDSSEIVARDSVASRRFAVRAAVEEEKSNRCRRNRISCIVITAAVVGFVSSVVGTSLAHSPQYHAVATPVGVINQCVAHCDDKQNNNFNFGLAGVIVGAAAGYLWGR